MSPKVKLTYFNGRGRGELSRLIMAAGDIPYENVRVTFEQWPQVKPTTVFGQLPQLEYDGVKLAQSMSIARFLAKKTNLAGKNELEQAQADMVVDLLVDFYNELKTWYMASAEEKPNVSKKCFDEVVPKFLGNLEKALKTGDGKHFAGNSLTWADIGVFEVVSNLVDPTSPTYTKRAPMFDDRRLDLLKDYPLLNDLVAAVAKHPPIAKWLKERPANDQEPF